MRIIAAIFIVLAILVTGFLLFAPREPVEGPITFSSSDLGDDIDLYLAASEAQFDDITPGTQKRIQWAGDVGARTTYSIVYIHGFSATSEEIRPVPDNVAQALGANLYYTRLTGHGRGGDAMAEATVPAWINDYAEAIAIGARLGERVIVMTTSTGGTIAALGAFDARIEQDLAGIIFVSPNFQVANPSAAILTLPLVRYWGPTVAGAERSFEAANPEHERFWTTRYPTLALLPMAASVQAAGLMPFSETTVPALFMFSDDDQVIDHSVTREVAAEWGGPVEIINPELSVDADPYAHVIAGDIVSPGMTAPVQQAMIRWIATLPN
ncbi:Esterase/lipase [Monaibacterium marinum]|uniref:Esterase/lipase n=1 Tax=Pontivivens marinum TaxID=1690039 RepID=A0A2C9CVW1_9RHOB|nr:alpha/beta fold hydrolase [Monaibacterium marinum]SOH95417.1 Esterase/lipase [Monaibacterium marinum]